jgi:vacuolar-type H+-ATPase subunit E/Vma4
VKEKLQSKSNDKLYKDLVRKMIEESTSRLDSPEIVIECNKNDYDTVKKIVQDLSTDKKVKLTLSKKPIDIVGGVRAVSADKERDRPTAQGRKGKW